MTSPCIKQCKLDPLRSFCTSCGRTLLEIKLWKGYTESERIQVMKRLGGYNLNRSELK